MKTIICIILFLITINSFSQMPEIVWQQCYGSPEVDKSYGIVTKGSGYLLAIHLGDNTPGATNYHGMGDIWILHTDSTGDIIWEKCFGGSNGDVPQKIIKKSENKFFIYGYTFSTDGDVQSGNNGYSDLWVVSINGTGDIIWENTYGCTGIDDPRDMILTPDGGFVMIDRIGVGGGDVTNFYGIGDVWMCKCDSLGNIEWEKTLGNQGLDNGVSMIINSEGNIMMIGAVQQHGGMVECYPDGTWGDVWLVELDLLGNIISQHCYGGSDYEYGIKIEEQEYGYIFIAKSYSNDGDVSGHHGPSGGNDAKGDFWIVEIDNQGEIIWEYSYGGYDSETPRYIEKFTNGEILAIGTTNSNDGDVSGNHSNPNGYDTDIWTVKLDSLGEIEWQQCYGGYGSERLENPHTILKKSDYDYIIASSTDYSPSYDVQCGSIGGVNSDAWIFEIKDCNYYASAVPGVPQGADTVCTTENTQTVFTVQPAEKALYYEWLLSPEEAGTVSGDSLAATVSWAQDFTGTAAVVVRSVNDCGESNWSQPHLVQVYSCIGIPEQQTEGMKLKVYPNPAKDFIIFELQGAENTGTVKIMNIFGETVATKKLSAGKTVVRLAGLESGLYFYRIESKSKALSGKFMVRK